MAFKWYRTKLLRGVGIWEYRILFADFAKKIKINEFYENFELGGT